MALDASPSAPNDLEESRLVEGLRLDVVPTEMPIDADAAATVLPQSVPLSAPLRVGDGARDLGAVELVDPVIVAGFALGVEVFPLRPVADLPGEAEALPVSGEVRLLHQTALQSYRASLQDDGSFDLRAVPEADYQLAIVPDTPSLPVTFLPLDARTDQDALDIDIGSGSSVYGFVTVAGAPVAQASVVLERDGVVSAAGVTNSEGFYEVRAQPGTYAVRSLGRPDELDPVLELAELVVDEQVGARHDVAYPTDTRVLVEGRVQATDGALARTVTVRFTASTLSGLETQKASYVTDVPTDDSFLIRMPPGIYDVEVLPPAVEGGIDYTPFALQDLVLDEDADIGLIELAPLRSIDATVSDAQQQLVPGVAVACREEGFDRRSWTTVTNAEGRFALDLPQAPVLCALTPPVERSDVALTRRTFNPADNASPSLELATGQSVTGRVLRDGEGEGFVVVELRDASEALLGSALTDEDGEYSMKVDLTTVP